MYLKALTKTRTGWTGLDWTDKGRHNNNKLQLYNAFVFVPEQLARDQQPMGHLNSTPPTMDDNAFCKYKAN